MITEIPDFLKPYLPKQSDVIQKISILISVNRFPDKSFSAKYFILDKELKQAFAVVSESDEYIFSYQIEMAINWNYFMGTNEMQIQAMPKGLGYDTGEPMKQERRKLELFITNGSLDITTNYDEVYFLLTGNKRKAFVKNVIG